MNSNATKLIYFSPTRTTQKVIEKIADGIQAKTIDHLDLTLPGNNASGEMKIDADLAVIGVPVYTGRVAQTAVDRIEKIKADKTPAVIVVVYGNRAYEDALLELKDLAEKAGFVPVAAGAFVGEHSFATTDTPIANGRPDTRDTDEALAFGRQIREKMETLQRESEIPPLQVPGNSPYRERTNLPPGSPVTTDSLCTRCGTCAESCPTGIITVEDSVSTGATGCIYCCACVKNCPENARVLEIPAMKDITVKLNKTCGERKAPEVFI